MKVCADQFSRSATRRQIIKLHVSLNETLRSCGSERGAEPVGP